MSKLEYNCWNESGFVVLSDDLTIIGVEYNLYGNSQIIKKRKVK